MATRTVTRPPLFYAPIVDLSALPVLRARREDVRLTFTVPQTEVYFVKYPDGYPAEWRI